MDRPPELLAGPAPVAAFDHAECAREPIHIPGAIQPHGALVAVQGRARRVTHASANLEAVLGRPASSVLGRPLAEAVGEAAAVALLRRPSAPALAAAVAVAGPDGRALCLHSFRSGARLVIDIEPAPPEPWQVPAVGAIQAAVETFRGAATARDLCQRAADALRHVTGHHRVFAYRFGADGHGEVIAESRAAGVEPFLGQHYPATDVPAQARAHYLRQRVGAVADSGYVPVPLLVDRAQDEAVPLDLTHSALRSVSPFHREYMRNMGTAASITIALAPSHDLWGLLVCHHAKPRVAGPALRAAAAIVGHVVSVQLAGLALSEVTSQRARRDDLLAALRARIGSTQPLAETFAASGTELLGLMEAAGALVRCAGETIRLGNAPEADASGAVFDALNPRSGPEIVATDHLAATHPGLERAAANLCGALMLPFGDGGEDAIVWLRDEQSRTVTWGGNPRQPRPTGAAPAPRALFRAWREVVRGRSAPWTEADRQLAIELRREVDAAVARRTRFAFDQFRRLFEVSFSALVLSAMDGSIDMLNRRAETLFGYDRADLRGLPVAVLVPERQRGQFGAHLARLGTDSAERMRVDGEGMVGRRKDGTEFALEVTLSLVQFHDGAKVMASLADVSARHRADQEAQARRLALERSNADLEEFSYAVSHDLKAPLRAIAHLVEWIGEDIGPGASLATHENMALLQGRVARMQRLLDGMLEYCRIGRGPRAVEDVDLGALVADIVAMLAPPPAFRIAYRGPPCVVRTERAALQLVMENLVGNALKHHDRPAGEVAVSAREAGEAVEIRVADDGPGIAPQFQQRIFAIFQTLKSRDEFESTGVGLAMVKRNVETHGGRISVESAPPARGAAFVFTWTKTPP